MQPSTMGLPTRRERRKERVRRELASAALKLFAEKGYAATTVEDIAEAVDYSASTFHRHFARKEDAAFHEVPRMAAELTELLHQPAEGEPWVVVKEALLRFAVEWDEDAGLGPASAGLFLTLPELRPRWLEITESAGDIIVAFLAREYGRDRATDIFCTVAAASAMLAARSAVQVQVSAGGQLVDHLAAALELVEGGLQPTLTVLAAQRSQAGKGVRASRSKGGAASRNSAQGG